MNPTINNAIETLEAYCTILANQGQWSAVMATQPELSAYREVRDGVSRNEEKWHGEALTLYRETRALAENIMGG